MNAIHKRSKLPAILLVVLIVVPACVLAVGVVRVRQARHEARRSIGQCRLGQMRLALQNYEQEHGALPSLCVRDGLGRRIHSWRTLILPYLDVEPLRHLDLAQPWNSDFNRKLIDSTPPVEWTWFARDEAAEEPPFLTHIFALIGEDSIWDAATGLPKAKTAERPNAILLISVPHSTIEALEPGDITEAEVCQMVEEGQEVR